MNFIEMISLIYQLKPKGDSKSKAVNFNQKYCCGKASR